MANIDMTVNFPSVGSTLAVFGLLWYLGRRGFQILELLLKTILWASRQQGLEVPDWLATQYKQVNGNARASKQEKIDVLGPKHDSGNHKAASGGE